MKDKSPYCFLKEKAIKRHQQRVYRIQDELYLRAKEDKSFRLYTGRLTSDPDFLRVSWEQRREANGAPGTDRKTVQMILQMGPEQFLKHTRRELKNGLYEPDPYRLHQISKGPNKAPREIRMGCIRDKVVMGAAELVYGPLLMADILPCCFPVIGRGPYDALNAIRKTMDRGRYVIYGDIVNFYPNIRHDWMLDDLCNRIADKWLLGLIRQWLKSYTVDRRNKRIILSGDRGIPQGAVTAPLWSAYYLTRRFDRPFYEKGWDKEFGATLVRYSDNIYVVCQRRPSELAARMELLLSQHELRLKETRVVKVTDEIPVLGFLLHKEPTGVKVRIEPTRIEKLRRSVQESHEEWKATAIQRIKGWNAYFGYAGEFCREEPETILQPSSI